MNDQIILQIILVRPTKDVDFGLQKGSGSDYEIIQKQRYISKDLVFRFEVTVKGVRKKDLLPKLSGPFVQGPANSKFVYIDIGTYAGQTGTNWSRRLKIPLTGITWEQVDELNANNNLVLETSVPGTGKDGGPNCAMVKPFKGWYLKEK